MELISLLANNVLLVRPCVYLAFRDHATSARHELRAAIDRLKARGVLEFPVREMIAEVLVAAPGVRGETVHAALLREVAKAREWVDPLPVERVRPGVYRII